ncbi:MAG: PAS domain S-box protein [Desulfobacteraceae bacterium]|nr:MAG: PAS domain S-box protein [Desulfobacteraceae bacterium]
MIEKIMEPFNGPERKEGKNSDPAGVDGIKTPKVDSQLSAIYQNAPLIMMLVDAEGRIKKVNRFAAEFAGRSESEMIGLHTGKALRCSRALDKHSENCFGPYCTECPIRGTIKDTLETERSHYQVQANPTLIIEGREQELTFLLSTTSLQIDGESMVLVTILDITQRKAAQEALRESEERYRGIVETAEEGIATHDPDGTITYVNQRMANMLGYSREEIIGRSSLDFVYDNEERQAVIRARESLKEEGSFSKERKLRRKDGSVLWTLAKVTPQRDGAGNFLGYLAMHTDITERKHAEEKLLESEERFRVTFKRAGIGMAIVDLDGRIIDSNKALQKMLGFSRSELAEMTFPDITHPDDLQEDMRLAQELFAGKRNYYRIEKRYFRKDGQVLWGQLAASFVRNQSGEPQFGIGMLEDITERKQAEAKQALLTDILRVHNRGGNLHSLTAETLRLIRVRTGFDSVGLRLRQGEDCPYFEHNGFSEEFLNEENFLCAKDGNGAIVRDAQGHTVLECTCGLVLSGRTVPGMSCFTEGGSFWTNISSELLSLPRESDPRFNPRNQCIHKGYQSVGLFPVRAGQEIIGLLQLNDRREGMFTPDLITFYESLAQNIGLAFQRAAAEEALWDLNEKLELQVTERTKLAESRAKQLARLTSELSLAEERERRRLAEVLHEHLQQLLVGVRLNLDALSSHVYGEKKPALDTALQLICDSIHTSRSITAELSPPILYQAGLVSGLKWLSRWKQEKYGFTVDLQVEPENIPLKEDMIVILFRSVRELLLNAVKHSGVNSAKVSLSKNGSDCLRIVVSDAGKGFNPNQIWEISEKQNGFGLFSIRERLEFLGGRLEIESAPGKGASFTLIAPVEKVQVVRKPSLSQN